jgi:hypothetical protein
MQHRGSAVLISCFVFFAAVCVQIADFGLSNRMKDGQFLKTR